MLLAAVGSGCISPSAASRIGCCTALTDSGSSSGQEEYSIGKAGGTSSFGNSGCAGSTHQRSHSVQIHLLSLGYWVKIALNSKSTKDAHRPEATKEGQPENTSSWWGKNQSQQWATPESSSEPWGCCSNQEWPSMRCCRLEGYRHRKQWCDQQYCLLFRCKSSFSKLGIGITE